MLLPIFRGDAHCHSKTYNSDESTKTPILGYHVEDARDQTRLNHFNYGVDPKSDHMSKALLNKTQSN